MKKRISTLLFMAMSATLAFAQGGFPGGGFPGGGFPGGPRGGFSQEPGKLYTITVGDITMTVDEKGGKVRSLKYADTEIISQSKQMNAWGATFWTSPQSEWNWPPVHEFDSDSYEVTEENGHVIMTSSVAAKIPMQIRKDFYTDPKKGCIVVDYYITNAGQENRKVAPWEITRVPSKGLVFFDCPVENIEAAQGELIKFKSEFGLSWYGFDVAPANRKINADGQGWLAYTNDGVMMLKTFDNITPDMPAPGEAEIQVYVNTGDTYTELEAQGAYKELKPGESLVWSVKWYVLPQTLGTEPSKALAKKVKKLVKHE